MNPTASRNQRQFRKYLNILLENRKTNWFIYQFVIYTLICSNSMALQAPFLISATAQSDSSIALSWRNNSTSYTLTQILRKDSTTVPFRIVDSTLGSVSSYIDKRCLSTHRYWYALRASEGTVLSDTSNTDSALTFSSCNRIISSTDSTKLNIQANPDLDCVATDNIIICKFPKTYCDLKGLILYRSVHFSQFLPRDTIYDIADSIVIWKDSVCKANEWYMYRFALFSDSVNIYSPIDTVFTYNFIELLRDGRRLMKIGPKVSEFPVYGPVWAILQGDSLLVKETNSPESTYSVIEVANSQNLLFKGYSAISSVRLKLLTKA